MPPPAPLQGARELRLSRWSTELPRLELWTNWAYSRRFHHVFGRFSYLGQPVYGFRASTKGVPGDGAGWLIIDDLVDTGKTAKAVRDMLPKAHFATVYAKPAGRPLVDTFITEVSQDTWILFPWDIEPQFIQPIARLTQP